MRASETSRQGSPRGRRDIESQAKALTSARAALDKQAEGVVILDVRSLSSVADFFVICTAGSARQIDALQQHIEETLRERGAGVWHTEAAGPSALATSALAASLQWVLMDCGDIVVHLFDERARAFYRLEDLWADAPRLALPSHSASNS